MPRSKLIEARNGKNWSQEKAAEKAGISRNFYAQIESGKRSPSLLTAKEIGRALGVKIDPTGLFNIDVEEDDYQ